MTTQVQAQHTPGPLEIHDAVGDGSYVEIHPAGDSDGLHTVAEVYDRRYAPIFAAAPEMLEALHAYADPCSHIKPGAVWVLDMVRAAIAKAEGR